MFSETTKQPHEIIESLRPYLVSAHSPAGSQFILSLFDGHTQILMLRGCVNLIPLFDEKLLSADHAFELFCSKNPYFFDTSEMIATTPNHAGFFFLGENQDEGFSTSKPDFIMHYREYMQNLPLNTRNIINAFYYAFAKAHNMDLSQKRVIVFQPYSHYMALKFYRIFPGSKSMVPVRHPINAWVSLCRNSPRRYEMRGRRWDHFYRLFIQSLHVLPLVKNNIEMIIWRAEDLTRKPKEVLSQLCKLMEIEYEPCLEKSTVMGKKYWGHSPDKRIYGFSSSLHSHIRTSEVDRTEKVMVLTLNKRLMEILQYEMPELTFFEKYFSLVFFLILRAHDINWLKKNRSKYRIFIRGFFGERFRMIRLFFRNLIFRKDYNIIKKHIIEV